VLTFIEPMAAQLVKTLPEGPQWLYELKMDGYRGLLMKSQQQVQLLSRNNKDLTLQFPPIVHAARHLKSTQFVLDGEIVVLDPLGRPSFQALQRRGHVPNHTLVYYAFDVLQLDGVDLTRHELTERRELLPLLTDCETLRCSDELVGSAAAVAAAVRDLGLEGVVAKRRDSPYQAGARSSDWQKIKFQRQQEFVIGGYRPDGSAGLDALVVGYYDADDLKFAAKVRAGFVTHSRRELLAQLGPRVTQPCPFVDLPTRSKTRWGAGITLDEMREFRWVTPELVAQIRFSEWTAEGRLRNASYLGLRPDKSPLNVRRE
jgi:bifunctional non-homologous end joining protein LigD